MIERYDLGSERQLTSKKGYDTAGFVAACRELCVTPQVSAKDLEETEAHSMRFQRGFSAAC